MSSVTTVILLLDCLLDGDARVSEINSVMLSDERRFLAARFMPLARHFGGPKVPQISAYGCAFNYVHCVHLIELLRSFSWGPNDVVQIVVNGEHDNGARMFDVIGKCDAEWPIERDWPCDADGNRMED